MPRRTVTLFPLLLFLATSPLFARDSAPAPNTLTPDEIQAGWILLFDGQTTFGWKATSKANWQVKDGVISVSEGEPGFLQTTSRFGDYLLQVDFRAPKGTNSGVFLHNIEQPKDPTKDCYELNVADRSVSPFPTGSFVGRQACTKDFDTSDWRTFEVRVRGGEFQVQLDGQTVLEYHDDKPLGRGFVGLQFNKGRVEFRNVKLQPLSLDPLSGGKLEEHWSTAGAGKSEFSVTDKGEIQMRGGPGQLESKAQFADFTLQMDVLSRGERLNSGVFFRSLPGQTWQGYESQIHSGTKDGDRAQPADYGTGGIYRRQPARRVVSDDFKWFTKTIAACEDHVAVWVNGFQVSDWTDDREPHENPRSGRRLEAGTILLQGHDATTDFLFRNIKAGEMAKRP
jgi:hypothetical protein